MFEGARLVMMEIYVTGGADLMPACLRCGHADTSNFSLQSQLTSYLPIKQLYTTGIPLLSPRSSGLQQQP